MSPLLRSLPPALLVLFVWLHASVALGQDEAEKLRVLRADYFTNAAGAWLSVEAATSAAAGTAPSTCVGVPSKGAISSACPILVAELSTNGRTFVEPPFGAVSLTAHIDTNTYLYHRALIRLSDQAGIASVQRPMRVRVTSDAGSQAVREVVNFTLAQHAPSAAFQSGFVSAYLPPHEIIAGIEALRAEYPQLAASYALPENTAGYRRPAMAVLGAAGCNASGCSAALRPGAVVVTSKAFGSGGAPYPGNEISIQFRHNDQPNVPLSVLVQDAVHGKAITVTPATNGTGTMISTAAQVVAAINATPSAAMLVTASTYLAGPGTGVVSGTVLTMLSDFLMAPSSIAREPFSPRLLRICSVCDGSRPGVLLTFGERGDEWVSPSIGLELASRLLHSAIFGASRSIATTRSARCSMALAALRPRARAMSIRDHSSTPSRRPETSRGCSARIRTFASRPSCAMATDRSLGRPARTLPRARRCRCRR